MRQWQAVTVAILALAIGASADVLFDNGLPSGYNSLSSQMDTVYPFQSQAADDFMVPSSVITGVGWYGNWWHTPPGNATFFNILIYADDHGQPTGAGMTDPTATALKVWHVPVAQVHEMPYAPAPGYYSYSADLAADPFAAQANTHYWLVVQSLNTYPPQWGFAATTAASGTAVQGFPLLGEPYWTPQNVELAFTLTGVPEPGGLLLLAAGVLVRRRR